MQAARPRRGRGEPARLLYNSTSRRRRAGGLARRSGGTGTARECEPAEPRMPVPFERLKVYAMLCGSIL